MNKAVPFWRKMFFKNNVNKIRQTIISYLKEEGIETELTDGVIIVIFDELHYGIHFDLENDYPKCNIVFGLKSEDYETLELYQKTFIADKVNTDGEHLSVVRAYKDSIEVDTSFFFNDKDMLLSLFYDYFCDIKNTVDEMYACLATKVEENEEMKKRRPIGFTANITTKKVEEENNMAACKE